MNLLGDNMTKIRKYLLIGIIGSIITVVGELSGGLCASTDLSNHVTQVMSAFDNIPVWRIGFCSSVGAIGILLQYYGYEALYLALEDKSTMGAKLMHYGNYGFTIFGSLVHVVLCMLIYVYHINVGNPNLYAEVFAYATWFVTPILVIFALGYLVYCLANLVLYFKAKSIFPKWCWLLNPLFGKLFFNILYEFKPGTALSNGISFANMGLTSLFTMIVFYLCLKNNRENIV